MADSESEYEVWEYPEFMALTYKDGHIEMVPIPQGMSDHELSDYILNFAQNEMDSENVVRFEIPPDFDMVRPGYEPEDS